MEGMQKPVDVIAICSADGSIRPLRLRIEDMDGQKLRLDIEQILSTREIPYVGVEAIVFRCRGRADGYFRTFDLKYSFRSHCWCLTHMV